MTVQILNIFLSFSRKAIAYRTNREKDFYEHILSFGKIRKMFKIWDVMAANRWTYTLKKENDVWKIKIKYKLKDVNHFSKRIVNYS